MTRNLFSYKKQLGGKYSTHILLLRNPEGSVRRAETVPPREAFVECALT